MTEHRHNETEGHDQPDTEPIVQYEDLEQATGFTQINNAVLRCYPELSDGEKMTYAVLKSFAYVGPETFVGQETLARARNSTVSTISRHLTRLIEVGLVKVRRRGQGKTNIWIIARIPRKKLAQYIDEWRPKLNLTQDEQTKTSQNPQVKNERNAQTRNTQNPQAEEEQSEEDETRENGRSSRHGDSSSLLDNTTTAASAKKQPSYSSLAAVVENSDQKGEKLSTIVESVDKIADVVVRHFEVPEQRGSIRGYLQRYEPRIAAAALDAVIKRVAQSEPVNNPVAYFYALTKIAQSEHDAAAAEHRRDENERRTIAINWARHLQREWPDNQVRAILVDTYHSEEFVDEIMAEIAAGDGA